jgi:hypothetical protein
VHRSHERRRIRQEEFLTVAYYSSVIWIGCADRSALRYHVRCTPGCDRKADIPKRSFGANRNAKILSHARQPPVHSRRSNVRFFARSGQSKMDAMRHEPTLGQFFASENMPF